MKRVLFWVWILMVGAVRLRGEPGTLDTGFGEGGTLALPLGGSANAVACQPDGKILVGGIFGVVRLQQDGRLDAGFGAGGRVMIGPSTNQSLTVGALLLQPDGKIVVSVGNALARLLSSGALDLNFGQDGFALVPAVTNRTDSMAALRGQPDGRIIGAGMSSLRSGGSSDFLVVCFTPEGVPDPGFGTGGRALTAFGSSLAACRAVAVQEDGGIVAGGGVKLDGKLVFGLARFTPNGVLDAGFGSGGTVVFLFDGATVSQINSLALQSGGRIIAAGIASGTNASDFAVARFHPDGNLDDSFGDHGIRRTDFSGGSRDIGGAVAVMSDEKIIVAGSTGSDVFRRKFALARYHPDGNLDGGFGRGGLVSTQFPQSLSDQANEMALVGDGRVILAGRTTADSAEACALVRYHVEDLSVLETASAEPVAVGDTFYYNVLIENHRSQSVTGVRLIGRLPSSAHFQSAFPSQGTCTNIGDLVMCDLGSLASNGQATVTIFVTLRTTAHVCNTVMVSANETDPALTNSAVACATIDLLREVPQNLAVTRIRAPKKVILDAAHPEVTQLVAVEIQNRSPHVERINDLTGVVDLEVRSLTNKCPDLVPVLLTEKPQAELPIILSPKAKRKVYFRVTYSKDCVPDRWDTDQYETHNDYKYVATVHHERVDDNRDTFPQDDTGPRLPVGNVTTTGRIIKDTGCARAVTDVIVQ